MWNVFYMKKMNLLSEDHVYKSITTSRSKLASGLIRDSGFTKSCYDYDKSFYVVKKHKNVTCKHHMGLAAELSIMA